MLLFCLLTVMLALTASRFPVACIVAGSGFAAILTAMGSCSFWYLAQSCVLDSLAVCDLRPTDPGDLQIKEDSDGSPASVKLDL